MNAKNRSLLRLFALVAIAVAVWASSSELRAQVQAAPPHVVMVVDFPATVRHPDGHLLVLPVGTEIAARALTYDLEPRVTRRHATPGIFGDGFED